MVRKLKHHEQKLLKKVNFHNWKSTDNVRENKILRKYFIQDRTDYSKYQELCRRIQKSVHLLRNMESDDEDRIRMTEILMKKLFNMGVCKDEQSLETIEKIPASSFCRRRLAVMVVRLRPATQSLHGSNSRRRMRSNTLHAPRGKRNWLRSKDAGLCSTRTRLWYARCKPRS